MLAFGNNGICIRSTNSGTNWNITPTGVTENLNTAFYNTTTVFSAGDNGTIIRSGNAGINWEQINFPLNKNIYGISQFLSPVYFFVCGQDGFIYYTSNQGVNWSQVNSNTTNNLRSIIFSTNFTLYRAFACGDNGTILKLIISIPPNPPVITSQVLNTGFANDLYSISMLSDSTVLMAAGSGGLIIKSTNGGLNWIQQQSGMTNNLRQIYRINPNEIRICGDNGTILRTSNGGANWIPETVNSNANLNSYTYLSISRSLAAGPAGTVLLCEYPPPVTDTLVKSGTLDGNNLKGYFRTDGMFMGLEWPKNSNKFVFLNSGFLISAYVNGNLRQATALYNAEYWHGTTNNGIPETPAVLKRIYKIKQGDDCYNSVDWANWGSIVPYGAPYKDMNNNNIYDPCIDTPGVKNASQTLFMVLTDGYIYKHKGTYGGSTLPLYADLRVTAWCYNDSILKDVQFLKFDIINKGNSYWDSVYFSFVCDVDLGISTDDYIGCDSVRNLGYVYNAYNEDSVYGTSPPAAGVRVLKFPVNKNVFPYDSIKTSSFSQAFSYDGLPSCEYYPSSDEYGAYNFIKGYKKDLSPWMSPVFSPPLPVKFNYGGDPETYEGWIENKGSVKNCGGPTGTIVDSNPPFERTLLLNMGKGNFRMAPGESNSVVMIQFVARGNSNTNSVTKLKLLSDAVLNFYNTVGIQPVSTEIPEGFSLEQNYPNPFNAVTKIQFKVESYKFVKLIVFDLTGREVVTLVNSNLRPGTYEVSFNASHLSSGIYFYRLSAGNFVQTKKLVLIK
jgi:photosystem II stability/assembly factor-like uncharacterized protein